MLREEKLQEVETIKNLLDSYAVIGIINMHKLPARQLQQIKHSINAKIKMSKKSLMIRAIESSNKKDIQKLKENISGPTALIFTNENPFRLFKTLKENRSPRAAKAGDIATKDIIVQKGPTSLPPGPAISVLQKVGLKASVQGGKIAVLQDKVVCKAGETVSGDLATVLSLLKIEPLEIGLDLVAAFDGILYSKSVLDIDVNNYIAELQTCVTRGVNLSLNTGYPTKLTIEMMLQKAFAETKSLCLEANILEKDFIDEVLLKAIKQATLLENRIDINK